jgi:hypothetical protein
VAKKPIEMPFQTKAQKQDSVVKGMLSAKINAIGLNKKFKDTDSIAEFRDDNSQSRKSVTEESILSEDGVGAFQLAMSGSFMPVIALLANGDIADVDRVIDEA